MFGSCKESAQHAASVHFSLNPFVTSYVEDSTVSKSISRTAEVITIVKSGCPEFLFGGTMGFPSLVSPKSKAYFNKEVQEEEEKESFLSKQNGKGEKIQERRRKIERFFAILGGAVLFINLIFFARRLLSQASVDNGRWKTAFGTADFMFRFPQTRLIANRRAISYAQRRTGPI